MGPEALALVLTAAVLHAVWNLAAKRVDGDGTAFVWLYVVGSTVLWVPVAVVWVVVKDERPDWSWVYAGLLTAVLHIVYQLVLQHGYNRGDLNLVYPAGPRNRAAGDLRVRGRGARRAPRPPGGGRHGAGRARDPADRPGPRPPRRVGPDRSRVGPAHRRRDRRVHALGQPRGQRPRRTAAAVLRAGAGAAAAGPDPAARAPTCGTAGGVAARLAPGRRGGGVVAVGLRVGAAGPAARAGLARRARPREQHRRRRLLSWWVLHEPAPGPSAGRRGRVLAGIVALVA